MFKRTLVVMAAAAVLVGCSNTPGIRLGTVREVSSRISQAPEGLVIVDVRTPVDFVEVRIEGAVLIDATAQDLEERLGSLDRDVPYVLYCWTGLKSADVSDLMGELGFKDVLELEGGLDAWIAARKPVVTG